VMISLKDENGFEVRIKKEKVYLEKYGKYYVNSFEFFVNGKNLFESILTKDKICANVDSLWWIKDEILKSINEQKHVHVDFIEPDIEIEVMPESCYYNRVWDGCKSKCKEDSDFVIIFHIDSRNFNEEDSFSYIGCNISITLVISQEQLLQFANDIEKEYRD